MPRKLLMSSQIHTANACIRLSASRVMMLQTLLYRRHAEQIFKLGVSNPWYIALPIRMDLPQLSGTSGGAIPPFFPNLNCSSSHPLVDDGRLHFKKTCLSQQAPNEQHLIYAFKQRLRVSSRTTIPQSGLFNSNLSFK
jgi:hypothetical protein